MRGYRVGMTDMMVERFHKGRLRASLGEAPRIAAGFLVGTLGAVATPDRGKRVERLGKLYRAAGKIAGLAGFTYEDYQKVHGAGAMTRWESNPFSSTESRNMGRDTAGPP